MTLDEHAGNSHLSADWKFSAEESQRICDNIQQNNAFFRLLKARAAQQNEETARGGEQQNCVEG